MALSIHSFISTLSKSVKTGVFPNFHFCGSHENDVRYVVDSIFTPHYSNKSMILEVHMLDNVSETSLVQMIQSFCGLQAVVSDFDNKPKLVIIHQQSEILTESFIHFLDNKMVENHVKFIFSVRLCILFRLYC